MISYTLSPGRGQVGVQNLSASGCGAFTGEVAAAQVKDFGLEWAILGHSERRTKCAAPGTAPPRYSCRIYGENVGVALGVMFFCFQSQRRRVVPPKCGSELKKKKCLQNAIA